MIYVNKDHHHSKKSLLLSTRVYIYIPLDLKTPQHAPGLQRELPPPSLCTGADCRVNSYDVGPAACVVETTAKRIVCCYNGLRVEVLKLVRKPQAAKRRKNPNTEQDAGGAEVCKKHRRFLPEPQPVFLLKNLYHEVTIPGKLYYIYGSFRK